MSGQTGPVDDSGCDYAAFISYRHAKQDRKWAVWLHNALETYRPPVKLIRARSLSRRSLRIFRDEEELSATSDLNRDIDSALRRSEFLIVVCSPRTPESRWVNEEVIRFRKMGRHDRILALLIEGEPREAFPASLCEIRGELVAGDAGSESGQEPLAADVRPSKLESQRIRKRMAKLRLLAPILGCRFDDLRQRDQERTTRRLSYIGVILFGLVIVISGLAVAAFVERNEAVQQRALAENRLLRLYVENGSKLDNEGDSLAALPWLVEPLKSSNLSGEDRAVHRLRVSLTLRQCPTLVHRFPQANDFAFSPDGKRMAVADHEEVRVCDFQTGRPLTPPIRHQAYSVLFSMDGSRIVTTGDGLRIWDASSGLPLSDSLFKGKTIDFMRQSPDGRYLVLHGDNPEIGVRLKILDLKTGAPLSLPFEVPGGPQSVFFSRDGRRCFVISGSKLNEPAALRVWDMQSKKQIAGPLGAGTSSVEAVRAAWTCEDGSRAATITEGGASRKSFAQVWEIDRGTTIGGEYTAPEGVVSAQLDRSGETLVLRTERAIDFRGATRESEVQLWDVNTHRQRGTTLRHNDDIKSAVISPNGEFVATQSQAAIRIWNVSNGEPVTPPVRHQGPLRGAAFSPDSRHIATFGSGDIRVWDLATAEVIAPLVPGYDSSLTNAMLCAMLPDEQRALSVDLWQTQVWNARTGQMLHSIRSPAATLDARFEPSRGQIVTLGEITSARGRTCNITVHDAHLEKSVIIKSISGLPDARCICLFPSGRQIAIGTPNGEVRLVDLVSGSSVRKPFQQQGDILQIAVSKDERFVAAVGTADVTLWDLKLAGRIPLKGRPQAGAKVVSLAPATPLLAIGTGRYGPGDVFVFEIPSGDLKFGPFAFQDELSALCFSEDGALLAAASRDGSARIWSMSDGLPITPFLQHGAAVNDISFYGSRPLLITAAGDSAPAWKPGGVRIWDARTGASVGPVLRHHLEVGRASTGRQGHVLFSAGSDVARLWDISQDERSDDDLILTGQLYGDHKIDASGAIVPLGPDDRRTRWAAICQRREAENGDESRQRALRWHRKRAHENELAANWKLASEHLDRVIAEESPDSVYYGRRAHANFQLGHSSACLDDCDRAIQLGANDTLIHHYRGCALSWMKRSSEALREHEMAARIANAFDGTVVGSDWRLELILWVASAQAELDRANEAARTLSAVPEALMSNCVWEFEQFAQRQRQARNWRSVVATLNPLAAEFRDESKYFIQRAEALTMLRQWERAEADYLAVVRLDPRNGDAFESMGDVRAELGRFEEAADAYQSAVERGNNRLSVGLNWTAVLAMTNRTQQYLENADQLMNLAERTKSAANRQAVVAALIGRDLDEQRNVRLLRIAQRCANEDPNTPWPMALLGAAQYRTKHYFLAAGILAPLVSETITPTPDPATFYFMALVNCWLGQSEIANRQFQQAKERAANSGQTVDWQTRARWNLLRQEVRQHLALDERRPVVAPRPDRAKRS